MGRPVVQLTRQQELALIDWWNARRPVGNIAKDLAVSARMLSRIITGLRKAGHRLIDRHGRLTANRRAAVRSARKAGMFVQGAAAAHRSAPITRAVGTRTGFVVAVGATRSAGNISRSPAMLVSKAIRQALSNPPVADVIVYNADGKATHRLDGLTKQKKPL